MEPLDKKDIKRILHDRFKDEVFKSTKEIPQPYCFAGMKEAVNAIVESMSKKEKIAIVGDYDVDGVVGTTILCNFFDFLSYPYEFVIPNRFHDGYGLSEGIIERIDADLVITVDNGITAYNAATLCKKRGIKLIITDHHIPSEKLPDALVIVNPKLPYCPFPQKEICGANVAWYLVAALKKRMQVQSYNMSYSLDILSLAIIADVMPLVGINRLLLKKGLKNIKISRRPAFVILKENFKKDEFNSEDVSYQIAPLLNSAGRMDDAVISVRFLLSKTNAEAQYYFNQLKELNQKRKEIECDIFEQAFKQTQKDDKVAIAYGKDWHEGVLGIVAAKLCDRLGIPSFVLTLKENTTLKGSGRSFGGINLIDLLQNQSHLFERFGGHKGAVGLEITQENIEILKTNLQNILDVSHKKQDNKKCMGEIKFESIDAELLEILDTFEPYGEANPKPRFICKGLVIKDIKSVGVHQNHTSLTLKNHHQSLKAIAFNQQYAFEVGKSVDTLFMLTRNIFAPEVPQLIIEDIIAR